MSSAICIIAIGDEVLSGMTLNRNSQLIALALTNRGWAVSEQLVVPDDPQIIEQVLRQRLLRGATVFAIGGLGPTLDDYTRNVVASLFRRPLVFSQKIFDSICLRFGTTCSTAYDQSMQPRGVVLFENLSGTAPGMLLEDNDLFDGARLFVLPGPTLEMENIFYNQVIPSFFPTLKTSSRVFKIYGLLESDIDPILRRIQDDLPQTKIGIYPAYDTVTVLFSLQDQTLGKTLDQAEEVLRKSLPNAVFLDPTISIEEQVFRNLTRHSWTLAMAESCTGGALSSRLTGVSGVSSVFAGGIVAYQNSVKESFLDVSPAVLVEHGPVCEAITEQMAQAALIKFHADVAVATSGYFGPSGGSKEAPIGTVCYTIHTPKSVYTQTRHFVGSRDVVCEKVVQAVLARLCVETL